MECAAERKQGTCVGAVSGVEPAGFIFYHGAQSSLVAVPMRNDDGTEESHSRGRYERHLRGRKHVGAGDGDGRYERRLRFSPVQGLFPVWLVPWLALST